MAHDGESGKYTVPKLSHKNNESHELEDEKYTVLEVTHTL